MIVTYFLKKESEIPQKCSFIQLKDDIHLCFFMTSVIQINYHILFYAVMDKMNNFNILILDFFFFCTDENMKKSLDISVFQSI